MTSHRSEAGVWLDRALGAAAAILLFSLMMLTTADVIGRYIFNWPLRGAFEITELLLLTLIFAGLPLASRADEHVTLDFIDMILSARGRLLLRRIVDFICGLLFLGLAYRVWIKADRIEGYGDTTEVLRIPVGPFVYFMAVMVAVTGIVHLVGLALMMVLALLRIPIAISMGVIGFLGVAYMRDWNFAPAFAMVETKVYETGRNYTLSVVPLFILMGNFVTRAGMSQQLFRAAYTCIGHLRGGLAMATVCACAGFGAICGSSIATAATMAKVAYPAMSELGYSDRLSTGAIAGGGTLGILIPPSTIMVIYGVLTETNIGKLFAAGILPGILATFLLCLAVQWIVWTDPKSGPRGERSTWRERLVALRGIWAVALLFIVVMGGIYGGVFTATEGAGVGAFGALCFALARRVLTWHTLLDALVESGRTTAMLFAILTGALMFAEFVNYTTMPDDLKNLVTGLNLSPIMVVAAICAIYVVLGTAMEELSMILLTVPVFFPVIVHLGLDPIWFGILIVVVVEIGLISPPVGMNLFVINALLPQVPTRIVFHGVLPFMVADVVRLFILVAFPVISLWLPSHMR